MHQLMIVAVIVASSALAFARPAEKPLTEPERTAIEKAVLEVSAQMSAAGEAMDAEKLFAYVLENDKGALVQNGKVLRTRPEALALVRANLRGLQSVRYEWRSQHVTVLSRTLALLVAEGQSSATTQDGRSFTTPIAQSLLLTLTKDGWRVLHAHQSAPVRLPAS